MNKCKRCYRTIVNDAQQCETCLLKGKSRELFGTDERWKDLGSIYLGQNCICRFSGCLLKIGSNASIDHLIARAKEGTNELDNLAWVHLWANLMKNDMPEDKFLEEFDDFVICAYNYRQLYKKNKFIH